MSEPVTDAQLDELLLHARAGHLEGQDYDTIEGAVPELLRLREELEAQGRRTKQWMDSWAASQDAGRELLTELRELQARNVTP
jgi:hypothetical protein